jgi:hypothetical protein
MTPPTRDRLTMKSLFAQQHSWGKEMATEGSSVDEIADWAVGLELVNDPHGLSRLAVHHIIIHSYFVG